MSEHECGCPAWVELCVHSRGEWLVLHQSEGWFVCRGQGETPEDEHHITALRLAGAQHGIPRDEALAAFHAEEAHIRQAVFG